MNTGKRYVTRLETARDKAFKRVVRTVGGSSQDRARTGRERARRGLILFLKRS